MTKYREFIKGTVADIQNIGSGKERWRRHHRRDVHQGIHRRLAVDTPGHSGNRVETMTPSPGWPRGLRVWRLRTLIHPRHVVLKVLNGQIP